MPDMSSVSNRKFDTILDVINEDDFSNKIVRNQIRSLWTAFCIHQNIEPDTREYDEKLSILFDAIKNSSMQSKPFNFEAFDLFMGEYLC